MREIKFRVWDGKEKKWLLGYEELGGFSMFGESMLFCEWSKALGDYGCCIDGTKAISDLKLMQFTGRNDINGTNVYDEDILGDTEGYVLGVVVWDEDELTWAVMSHAGPEEPWCVGCISDYEPCSIEVLGNICENPELLQRAVVDVL